MLRVKDLTFRNCELNFLLLSLLTFSSLNFQFSMVSRTEKSSTYFIVLRHIFFFTDIKDKYHRNICNTVEAFWQFDHKFCYCALCVEDELRNLQTTKANFIFYLQSYYQEKKVHKNKFSQKKINCISINRNKHFNLQTTKPNIIY